MSKYSYESRCFHESFENLTVIMIRLSEK
ncbi:Hypothetical protein SRAE_1000000100, partial [Strongyloides ratti]